MRPLGGLLALVILFAILSVIFGVWAFVFAAAVAWVGIKIIFWICLILFLLSLIGWSFGSRSPIP
jgi:hypothetical protein